MSNSRSLSQAITRRTFVVFVFVTLAVLVGSLVGHGTGLMPLPPGPNAQSIVFFILLMISAALAVAVMLMGKKDSP